jgi:TonB family protein
MSVMGMLRQLLPLLALLYSRLMRALVAILVAIFVGLTASSSVAQQGSPPATGSASHADVEKSLCEGDLVPGRTVPADEKITQDLLIYKVTPAYPKAARKAHIEGTVVLCANISKEGQIKNLRSVAGPPELIPPSIEAVKQWRYKPYLVSGEAVEVSTEIEVNYALEHARK